VRGYIWQRKDRGKGVYTLRVDAGTDPFTGKRRQVSRTIKITGSKPKQQAQQKLTELLAEVDAGHHRSSPHAGMTVGEGVEKWFASFHAQVRAGSKGVGTERKYREVIDFYILPRLGQVPLADLTTEAIDTFYEQLLISGRTGHGRRNEAGQLVAQVRPGGPLSPGTIRNVHTVMRLMCARAVRYRWVPSMRVNPAIEASPPGVKKRKKTPPTSLQAQAILDEGKRMDPDWYTYLRLAAAAGDRRGEVSALHHSAFNLVNPDRATMRIETALSVGLNGVIETEAPKSDTGFRTISIGRETALAVRNVMRQQKERALACGSRLVDDPYLFAANVEGSEPWDPRRVTRRFTYLRNKLGLKSVRLNDLRHYVATQLLGQGVDVITVAGRLGHDPTVTQRVYAEFIAENDRAAADIMEDLLDNHKPQRRRRPSTRPRS
jgi:integrase